MDFIFHFSLSTEHLLSRPKHFSLTQISLPFTFFAYIKIKSLGKLPKTLIFHFSCILDLGFWVFDNFWGFWDFSEIVGLGVFDLILYAHALHSNCILTIFHAFRCMFDIVERVLVVLDWVFPMIQFHFCTSHIHAFFIHTSFLFFFPCYLLWCVLSLSLSLSLFDRLHMAPKV